MHTLFRSVDGRWEGLCNALAGPSCAFIYSLNDMRMTTPSHFFCLEGSLPCFHPDMTYQPQHMSLPSSTSPHTFPQADIVQGHCEHCCTAKSASVLRCRLVQDGCRIAQQEGSTCSSASRLCLAPCISQHCTGRVSTENPGQV